MGDDARGDAIYETWRRGGNPDLVDYDRVDEDVRLGYDRFDAASREASRIVGVPRDYEEQRDG